MSASKRKESFYLNEDAMQDWKKGENTMGMNGLQWVLFICSNKLKMEFQTKKQELSNSITIVIFL